MEPESSLEKLDYVYKFIEKSIGDKSTALQYLKDVAEEIDMQQTPRQCPTGSPIPTP